MGNHPALLPLAQTMLHKVHETIAGGRRVYQQPAGVLGWPAGAEEQYQWFIQRFRLTEDKIVEFETYLQPLMKRLEEFVGRERDYREEIEARFPDARHLWESHRLAKLVTQLAKKRRVGRFDLVSSSFETRKQLLKAESDAIVRLLAYLGNAQYFEVLQFLEDADKQARKRPAEDTKSFPLFEDDLKEDGPLITSLPVKFRDDELEETAPEEIPKIDPIRAQLDAAAKYVDDLMTEFRTKLAREVVILAPLEYTKKLAYQMQADKSGAMLVYALTDRADGPSPFTGLLRQESDLVAKRGQVYEKELEKWEKAVQSVVKSVASFEATVNDRSWPWPTRAASLRTTLGGIGSYLKSTLTDTIPLKKSRFADLKDMLAMAKSDRLGDLVNKMAFLASYSTDWSLQNAVFKQVPDLLARLTQRVEDVRSILGEEALRQDASASGGWVLKDFMEVEDTSRLPETQFYSNVTTVFATVPDKYRAPFAGLIELLGRPILARLHNPIATRLTTIASDIYTSASIKGFLRQVDPLDVVVTAIDNNPVVFDIVEEEVQQAPPEDETTTLRVSTGIKSQVLLTIEVENAQTAPAGIFPEMYSKIKGKILERGSSSPVPCSGLRMQTVGPSLRDLFEARQFQYRKPDWAKNPQPFEWLVSLLMWTDSALHHIESLAQRGLVPLYLHPSNVCISLRDPAQVTFSDARFLLDVNTDVGLELLAELTWDWDDRSKQSVHYSMAPEVAVIRSFMKSFTLTQRVDLQEAKDFFRESTAGAHIPFPRLATYLWTGDEVDSRGLLLRALQLEQRKAVDSIEDVYAWITEDAFEPFGDLRTDLFDVLKQAGTTGVYAVGSVLVTLLSHENVKAYYRAGEDARKLYGGLLGLALQMLDWNCAKRIKAGDARARIRQLYNAIKNKSGNIRYIQARWDATREQVEDYLFKTVQRDIPPLSYTVSEDR